MSPKPARGFTAAHAGGQDGDRQQTLVHHIMRLPWGLRHVRRAAVGASDACRSRATKVGMAQSGRMRGANRGERWTLSGRAPAGSTASAESAR